MWPCPAQLHSFQGPDVRPAMGCLPVSSWTSVLPALCVAKVGCVRVTSWKLMEEKASRPQHVGAGSTLRHPIYSSPFTGGDTEAHMGQGHV